MARGLFSFRPNQHMGEKVRETAAISSIWTSFTVVAHH
jgi:hypothetical protein